MDSDKIRELLEKYWNCETSISEEIELRVFFDQENIPDDLVKYSSLFRYLHDQSEYSLDDEFDKKLLGRIEKQQNTKTRRYLNILYKVAAVIALLVSLVVIHHQFIDVREREVIVVEDTYEDPRKALEETRKILYFVSEKLNKGKEEVSKISKFNEAEEVIKKSKYEEI